VSIKHLSERWNPNATNPLHYLDQAALDVYVRPREPDVHTVPIGIKVEIDEFWNNVDGGATGIWIDAPPFDPYSNGAAIAARGDISTIGNGSFNGNLAVSGTITKGSGTFKIDHPLDPENKYLSHSFVESPDMMNIYNGNATLDAQGEAWVTLPEWFQPLNRDFRYQLTALGKPSPSLYVADEISGNRFRIAGGAPNGRVSWQVTGIRQDAFANAHRVQVEEQKSERDIGSYLHPNEHGLPQERLIGYERIVKPFIDNRAARREKSNRPATRDGAQER